VTVLSEIRRHTSAAHESLEHELDVIRRLASPAGRLSLMQAFYALYEPAERALGDVLVPISRLHFAKRRKAPVLVRDLHALGLAPEALAALPRAAPPSIGGVSHALGFAYVFEGASLGGRVIRKRLSAAGLPLTGTEFFDVYGEDAGTRWRQFCDVLESECADPCSAVAGACYGFEFIGAGLMSRLADMRDRRASRED
jgi:heme oxygenase